MNQWEDRGRSPVPPASLVWGREYMSQAGAPGVVGQCEGAKAAILEPRREVTVASWSTGGSGHQKPP